VAFPLSSTNTERAVRTHYDLTDDQWDRVKTRIEGSLLCKNPRGRAGHDTRDVLNDVLWVLSTGAAWRAVPCQYPSHQTCHRRFWAWHASGVLLMVLHELFGAEADLIYENIELRMRRQRIMPQTRVTDAHGIGW
jgi:transposase